jgi:hypothetical protein
MAGALSDEQVVELEAMLFAGRRIEAVKLCRAATGKGLAEALAFVNAVEAELRATSPERFTAPPRRGCGATAAVVIAALGGAAAWAW